MDNFLWEFSWDMRGGSVESLFVATEEEVKALIGSEVSFGEVLGKHSDVRGTIDEGDIIKLDVSTDAVNEVSKHLGKTWSGFTLSDYIRHQCNGVVDDERCEEAYTSDDMYLESDEYYCYDCYHNLGEQKDD